MSYNISRWITKNVKDFKLPIEVFNGKKNKHYQQEVLIDKDFIIIDAGEGKIEGYLKDGMVYVTEISILGETSGSFFREIFEKAVQESEGTMEAVLIWEGGDSITRFLVTEDEYSNEEIDL